MEENIRQNLAERRIELSEERLTRVEDSILTLNHELGEVIGELKTIKWLLTGSVLAITVNIVVQFI